MTTQPDTLPAAGELLHVDPATLLLERNIREAVVDDDFLASVKTLGVLEPITAVRNDDDALVVRTGHRRTLAAVKAGLTTVPVYVTGRDSLDTTDEIVRMVAQRDENTHRAALTAADQVGFVEQMAAFGLPAGQIAQLARIKRDDVDVALKVAGSELATKATARHADLTLDQAAVVAKYEHDTEFVKQLVITAVQEPDRFAHVVARRRQDDLEVRLRQDVADQIKGAGIKLLKERPYYSSDKAASLSHLTDVKTVEAHATCPGHAAWIGWARAYVDDEDQVMPDRLDGETDEQRSRRLARGHETNVPAPEYGCADWKANGHKHAYGSSSSKPKAEDLTPAQREKAAKLRRLVVENNKAWDAAQPVRREWLAAFAKTKTPPKGTAAFIAEALTRDRFIIGQDGASSMGGNGIDLAVEWGLTTKTGDYGRKIVVVPASATEGRALVITLVVVLASFESAASRDWWRGNGKTSTAGRYLRFLEAAGYGLSDVEKFAISTKTA